jgi:hypothetical protein
MKNMYFIVEDESGIMHFCKSLKKMLSKADKLESAGINVTVEIIVEL